MSFWGAIVRKDKPVGFDVEGDDHVLKISNVALPPRANNTPQRGMLCLKIHGYQTEPLLLCTLTTGSCDQFQLDMTLQSGTIGELSLTGDCDELHVAGYMAEVAPDDMDFPMPTGSDSSLSDDDDSDSGDGLGSDDPDDDEPSQPPQGFNRKRAAAQSAYLMEAMNKAAAGAADDSDSDAPPRKQRHGAGRATAPGVAASSKDSKRNSSNVMAGLEEVHSDEDLPPRRSSGGLPSSHQQRQPASRPSGQRPGPSAPPQTAPRPGPAPKTKSKNKGPRNSR